MLKRLFLFTTACRQGKAFVVFCLCQNFLLSFFLSFFLSSLCSSSSIKQFTKNEKPRDADHNFYGPHLRREGRKESIYVYIYIYIWKENQSFLSSCSPWSLNFFPRPDRLTIDSAPFYIQQMLFSSLSPTYFQLAIPDLHNNSLATEAGKFSSMDWVFESSLFLAG